MVRKKTPFDDHAQAIQQLIVMIKEQLAAHAEQIKQLRQQLEIEQQRYGLYNNDNSRQYSEVIIDSLQSRLLYSNETFSNVIENRTRQMKQRQERSQLYSFDASRRASLYSNRGVFLQLDYWDM